MNCKFDLQKEIKKEYWEKGKNLLEAEERAVKVMIGGEEKGRWGVKGERRLGARDRDRV